MENSRLRPRHGRAGGQPQPPPHQTPMISRYKQQVHPVRHRERKTWRDDGNQNNSCLLKIGRISCLSVAHSTVPGLLLGSMLLKRFQVTTLCRFSRNQWPRQHSGSRIIEIKLSVPATQLLILSIRMYTQRRSLQASFSQPVSEFYVRCPIMHHPSSASSGPRVSPCWLCCFKPMPSQHAPPRASGRKRRASLSGGRGSRT